VFAALSALSAMSLSALHISAAAQSSTAESSALASVSTSAISLDSLPDAVLLYLADSFMQDREAARCARACHITLRALHAYKFKYMVSLATALRFADGSSSADAAANSASAAVTDVTTPPPRRSPLRIGLVQSVTSESTIVGVAQLGWLPRSVTVLLVNAPRGLQAQQAPLQLLPPQLSLLYRLKLPSQP